MAAQGFIARVGGKFKQVFAILTSAGAADSGKIPALDAAGKLDASFLPTGIGSNSVVAVASEAIAAGKFVNLYANAGVLTMRLADNSNGREAWGYVTSAVANAANGTAFRLNTVNASMASLTPGGSYYLGTAGGVIAAPLDPAVDIGKLDQFIGIAKSATELVTSELDPVLL